MSFFQSLKDELSNSVNDVVDNNNLADGDGPILPSTEPVFGNTGSLFSKINGSKEKEAEEDDLIKLIDQISQDMEQDEASEEEYEDEEVSEDEAFEDEDSDEYVEAAEEYADEAEEEYTDDAPEEYSEEYDEEYSDEYADEETSEDYSETSEEYEEAGLEEYEDEYADEDAEKYEEGYPEDESAEYEDEDVEDDCEEYDEYADEYPSEKDEYADVPEEISASEIEELAARFADELGKKAPKKNSHKVIEVSDKSKSDEEIEKAAENYTVKDALNSLKNASKRYEKETAEDGEPVQMDISDFLLSDEFETATGITDMPAADVKFAEEDKSADEETEMADMLNETEDVSEEYVQENSEDNSDEIFEEVSDEAAEHITEDVLEEISEEDSEENPEDFSETADDISEEGSENNSEETVVEVNDRETEDDGTMLSDEEILSSLVAEYREKIANIDDETPVDIRETVMDELKSDGMEAPKKEVKPSVRETKPVVDDEPAFLSDDSEMTDETAVISEGMTVRGNIESTGNLDLLGSVFGDITILGKLNISGRVTGNTKANEVFIDGAEIGGDIEVNESVKVGQDSVIIGDIKASSAVIAGAVKGDIDVHGPVILDSSAIIMGNIKSMSVQINNGAIVEGLCSQCYAPVNPSSFFDEFKKRIK